MQDAFGEDIILSPKSSFRDIFTSVQSTTVERAVVPVENSTNGAVIQILDLLADQDAEYKDVTVCGEHYLPVHHCLLVQRNEDEALLKNSGQCIDTTYNHHENIDGITVSLFYQVGLTW